MISIRRSSKDPGSFRDTSGFIFYKEDALYRQINISYKENYNLLISSGLYHELVKQRALIAHEETGLDQANNSDIYKVIKPAKIPFISYPYEWSFSRLKDAALLTLAIEKTAVDRGMSLKDASAYNIQFAEGRPVFIDTLSFEKYQEGKPWIAYRQFCQHFLAPLALMSKKDARLGQLLRVFIDGIPLDLAVRLLPFSTRFNPTLLFHIHLHSKSQKYFSERPMDFKQHSLSRRSFLGLINHLESSIARLSCRPSQNQWTRYYDNNLYSAEAFTCKKGIVEEFLDKIKPKNVWDLGSNSGVFSKIAADKGASVICFDADHTIVEENYLQNLKVHKTNILPLWLDLTNPSPFIGWANEERMSLTDRGPADLVLCLAMIHHFALSNNVPMAGIAGFLKDIGNALIIEFVPISDPQARGLLSCRDKAFINYTQEDFEREFNKEFDIISARQITDTERTIYLMKKR